MTKVQSTVKERTAADHHARGYWSTNYDDRHMCVDNVVSHKRSCGELPGLIPKSNIANSSSCRLSVISSQSTFSLKGSLTISLSVDGALGTSP
ncbi:hypothetical protein TNCV_2512001 [Trichonephila clavipes]|nr:hypothetical protein TNCV_2512001 [Trichonephila clavipes]